MNFVFLPKRAANIRNIFHSPNFSAIFFYLCLKFVEKLT